MVPERDRIAVRAEGAAGWNPRYHMLDSWRGLACLMVVVHHAGYALEWTEAEGDWARWLAVGIVRYLSLGVPLFFVISGYCIAASADATIQRGNRPDRSCARRIWRIYPPYWFALLGFLLMVAGLDAAGLARYYSGPLGVKLDPPRALDGWQWLGNITLTETWRPHFGGPPRQVFTGVAWSLCFEEQFYALCCMTLVVAPAPLVPAGRTSHRRDSRSARVRLVDWRTGRIERDVPLALAPVRGWPRGVLRTERVEP